MNPLSEQWLIIPLVGLLIFFLCFFWVDRIINWLHDKSLGQREEVLRILELCFVEIDQKRVTQFMLFSSIGPGIILFLLFWPNLIAGALFGFVLMFFLWRVPKPLVQMIYEKRCMHFNDQMVDGLTLMANGIRAGLSVQQSMERVQQNMPNPMSQEFGLVLSQLRLGQSLQDALNELAQRIPRQDVKMFVTAINILQETGGNLAETFQTIVHTVRERQKIEKKIEAMTTQGMTQGTIITLIPFALLAVLSLIDWQLVRPLFTTTLGLIALAVVIILQVLGGLMMRKMVRINV